MIIIGQVSDYDDSQGKIWGGDSESQTSPHGREWGMLTLLLTPQPVFKDFGPVAETQVKHVHC